MAHIFISYSKKDIDFVRYLRALLEGEGFAVWMDEARLQPSARWWKDIEKNIETCAAFVVVMSPDAAESDWVEREILLAEKLKKPLFPVLLAGESWSRLANIQYEDCRAGLRARLSARFLDGLRGHMGARAAPSRTVALVIEPGNIAAAEADVAAFKYARGFHGADALLADLLDMRANISRDVLQPEPDQYVLVETGGVAPVPLVLYVGTVRLRDLHYPQIRAFAARVLSALAEAAPHIRHLAMTIHGPGFGLDEVESLRSQVEGYRDALAAGTFPPALERITIVEFNPRRADRLKQVMADHYAAQRDGAVYHLPVPAPDAPAAPQTTPDDAGRGPVKPHAYVALPAAAEFEDVFFYGVQTPVHAAGLLCERVAVEQPALPAEQLEQIRSRIAQAAVVVADVTGSDPHVYMQVGYAWGKGCPVILLVRDGAPAALEGQPIFTYQRIRDVETALTAALDELKARGALP